MKHRLAIAAMCAVVCSGAALAADDSSLDSMWMDQPAPPAKDEPLASLPPPVSTGSAVAPMCTLEDFKTSAIVGKGAWPGVGPFTPSTSNDKELMDANHNRLSLEVASGQVTKAELALGKIGVGARDFLDIQMTAAFLLEGLGCRPKKIAEFTNELEKNKDALMGRPAASQFPAGRYLVTIDRARQGNCVIAVNSLDANKTIIKEHSVATEPVVAQRPDPVVIKPVPAAKPRTPQTQAMNPTIDPKRDQFAEALRTWQTVKKAAIRKRDTTGLPEILSGRALARQTDAVKWLVTNKKYYEMTPKGVTIQKYEELTPGKKYLVLSQVREFSKFIDEGTGQVLKEVDDSYTVNYTIEKIGDKFMITDSALLPAGQQKPQTTKR